MIIFHLLKLVLLYCPTIWPTTYIGSNQLINMAQTNELGGAWRTHEKWETYKRFWLDKRKKRGNVYDVGMEGRITMNRISEKMGRMWDLEWIRSGQGQWEVIILLFIYFLSPMPPHVLVDFVVLPPGHGRSVTDFWGWDVHEAQLCCPDDVSGDIGGCSARRALKSEFY